MMLHRHRRLTKKLNREDGFAMVMTLLILILMTLVLVASFQNSTIGMFINQNMLDQPVAQNSATACENHMIRRVKNKELSQFQLVPNATNLFNINCVSSVPVIVEKNTKLAGSSTNLKTIDLRFRTTAQGLRNSNAATFTDVTVIYDAE